VGQDTKGYGKDEAGGDFVRKEMKMKMKMGEFELNDFTNNTKQHNLMLLISQHSRGSMEF